jgi:hypothetical protein
MTDHQFQRQLKYAWLAGIIDGKGNITIKQDNRKTLYTARLDVELHHEGTILTCREVFGNGFLNQRRRAPHLELLYLWGCAHRDTINMLNILLPFLVTKKKQAECILKFAEAKSSHHEIFFDEIKKLNQIGV